jgi:molecular chaperone IbpA
MRTYDFSPLFRSTVGFDRLSRMLETAMTTEDAAQSYPPYNIELLQENRYRITMAVAGFSENDLEIVSENSSLTIRSKAKAEADKGQYLHRGIAGRAFERRFQLADHIHVTGATMENGLLHVELERQVPEQLKPRTIAIGKSHDSPAIEHSKAA